MIQGSPRLNLWDSFLTQSKCSDGHIKQAVQAQNWSQKKWEYEGPINWIQWGDFFKI